MSKLDALTDADLEALEADRERLDWLQSQRGMWPLWLARDGRHPWMGAICQASDAWECRRGEYVAADIREAIDLARAAQEEAPRD